MRNTKIEVKIYKDKNGKEPLVQWLYSLKDVKTRARIKKRLERIERGNLGDTRVVCDGVFELRFHFGAGYRVYFGEIKNTIVLLLCGGDKSTQAKDIKKAENHWKDYQEVLL